MKTAYRWPETDAGIFQACQRARYTGRSSHRPACTSKPKQGTISACFLRHTLRSGEDSPMGTGTCCSRTEGRYSEAEPDVPIHRFLAIVGFTSERVSPTAFIPERPRIMLRYVAPVRIHPMLKRRFNWPGRLNGTFEGDVTSMRRGMRMRYGR